MPIYLVVEDMIDTTSALYVGTDLATAEDYVRKGYECQVWREGVEVGCLTVK